MAKFYELVELTDSLGELGEDSEERRRAELVATLNCFFVCSCMILGRSQKGGRQELG